MGLLPTLDREGLSKLWPEQLNLLDCAASGQECATFSKCPCGRLSSPGRVINGRCECCDTFEFVVSVTGSIVTEELIGATFYRSFTREAAAAAAAKEMVSALVPEGRSGVVAGEEGRSTFHQWVDDRMERSVSVRSRVIAAGSVWTAIVDIDVDLGAEAR
jgi:hypothetical protein